MRNNGQADQVEFDSLTHRYRIGARELPSVTTVLSFIERFDHIDPGVLELARERGEQVHAALAGDPVHIDAAIAPYVEAGQRFLHEAPVAVMSQELQMASTALGYAGTADVIGLLRGRLCLFDWKCTSTMPRSVGPQTWAYAQLYRAVQGDVIAKRYCVLLAPYRYRLIELRDPRDPTIFRSCLNLWRYTHA